MASLRGLFNIHPGEGRRTGLLYALTFVLILGSVWGETAAEALFIDKVGLDSFSVLFITEAVFALFFTLVYTAFVDRISNTNLLAAICIITIGALLVARGLFVSGPAIAYYLFYLVGRTTRVIFTVHVWTYIGDFYDTRAARRLFPFIGSSGRISGFLGGLAFPLVISIVGVQNIPLIWVGLLVVAAWIVLSIPRWDKSLKLPQPQGRTAGVLDNFKGGWEAIRHSRLLQMLALGGLTVTLLLALLRFQANFVFFQAYPSADELASVLGLLTGLANALALPFQLFLLTRIVNRTGVGWANLIYPLLAFASFTLLGIFSILPFAVFALFVWTALRWGIRNPIDNMLYNAVPRQIKGRARAFVNGMLVPVATFLAGALLLLVPKGRALPPALLILGGAVGLVYLFAAWRTRAAYKQSLIETLAVEDTTVYEVAPAEWSAADRAALEQALGRLRASTEEGETIFLAQVAFEVGGRDALPDLIEAAAGHGPIVYAAILEIVGDAGLSVPEVHRLCLDGLAHPSPVVRRAALLTIDENRGPDDMPLVGEAVNHLHDPDIGVQARAISLLLRSGNFAYLRAASAVLRGLLARSETDLRAMAVSVLGEMGDPRVVRTLVPYLRDGSESVRRAAAQALALVATGRAPAWVCRLTFKAGRAALADSSEAIRLAGVQMLAKLDSQTVRPVLLQALRDRSLRVRESARRALQEMGSEAVEDLEALLKAEDMRVRGTALVALLQVSVEKYRAHAAADIYSTLRLAYRQGLRAETLAPVSYPSAKLIMHTFDDDIHALLDHIYRVLDALHGRETVRVIQHNLASGDLRARANAIEALETLTSPLIARLVAPLAVYGVGNGANGLAELAEEALELEGIEAEELMEELLTGPDPWLQAAALSLVGEAGKPSLDIFDMPKLISRRRRNEVITDALEADDPLVLETARRVALQFRLLEKANILDEVDKEAAHMLTTIEKVIFLKEIPFFNEMTVAQLRALAGIAEETTFQDGEIISGEGEMGDTLYVVVNGRVGLEHKSEESESVGRVATLEARQYFGETSIFSETTQPMTAVSVGEAHLLSIRREPLVALVEGDPTLALELIRVLSRRLHDANEELAKKTRVIPRKLHKLYDDLSF